MSGRFEMDMTGWLREIPDTGGMMFPARCRWCGGVYDLAGVTVTARYADCSVWKAPCCGVTADDRKPPWGISHYTELPRQEAPRGPAVSDGPGLVCPGCGSPDVDIRRGLLCGTCAKTVAGEGGGNDG